MTLHESNVLKRLWHLTKTTVQTPHQNKSSDTSPKQEFRHLTKARSLCRCFLWSSEYTRATQRDCCGQLRAHCVRYTPHSRVSYYPRIVPSFFFKIRLHWYAKRGLRKGIKALFCLYTHLIQSMFVCMHACDSILLYAASHIAPNVKCRPLHR